MDDSANIFHFCQNNWSPAVQSLTFKSKFIRVDRNLFDFLLEDGIYIHPKYNRSAAGKPSECVESKNNDIDDNNGDDGSSNQSNPPVTLREFSSVFENTFASALEEFDCGIFMKLGWRAPRDTENWLHGLEITNMEDMLTALKSSGILADILEKYEKDFAMPEDDDSNTITLSTVAEGTTTTTSADSTKSPEQEGIDKGLYIILKKHYTIHKHLLVRCFVKNGQLIAMCQRHCSSVNHTLGESKAAFQALICEFFTKKLSPHFTVAENYVFDVYFASQAPKYRVKLVDINPWRHHTNPLLFDWDQLESLSLANNEQPELRTVTSEDEAIIEDLSAYRVPEEMYEGEDQDDNDDQNASEDGDDNLAELETQMLKEGKLAQLFDYLNTHNPDLYQN